MDDCIMCGQTLDMVSRVFGSSHYVELLCGYCGFYVGKNMGPVGSATPEEIKDCQQELREIRVAGFNVKPLAGRRP